MAEWPSSKQPLPTTDRRPADGGRDPGRRAQGRRAVPDTARSHRHRQDGHDGLDDRGGRPPGARDRAQQDAGGAALQRVQGILPEQRSRVLRLLLRLLPARGVRPQADLYIEKDSSQNDDIARLRLAATSSLFTRRDVVVVASVSCIYGLGSPEEWRERVIILEVGAEHDRDLMLRKLIDSQYVATTPCSAVAASG